MGFVLTNTVRFMDFTVHQLSSVNSDWKLFNHLELIPSKTKPQCSCLNASVIPNETISWTKPNPASSGSFRHGRGGKFTRSTQLHAVNHSTTQYFCAPCLVSSAPLSTCKEATHKKRQGVAIRRLTASLSLSIHYKYHHISTTMVFASASITKRIFVASCTVAGSRLA